MYNNNNNNNNDNNYLIFKVGMTIYCRILSVNIEKFSVDLSSRSSDLLDRQGRFRFE